MKEMEMHSAGSVGCKVVNDWAVGGGNEGDPAGCRTNKMEKDPIGYKVGEEGSDYVGCRLMNWSTHLGCGPSLLDNESPKCKARKFGCSDIESNMGPSKCTEGASDPNECRAGESSEQFPDTNCLGVSCEKGNSIDCPYEICSTNEFVMMCDYVAADDTQCIFSFVCILSFQRSLSQGDKVLLHTAVTADWWWVEQNGVCGYVPSSHLRGIDDEDPWQDDEYYGSYKTLKLHLERLSDYPRTQTYKDVITQNSPALTGKRILDLGCGTGIISFFCVKLAQPEIVYAVEASEIAEQTRKLVEENGFSGKVQVLCQRAEELELPAKVDVLVSEWMGTCLLFEFMLESVLIARDLWLNEDGVMWPSTACIHMVPCSADKEYSSKVLFWDSPYELDFSVFKPVAIQEFLSKPQYDYVLKAEDCLSQPCVLLNVDTRTLKTAELERMSGDFKFHVDRDDSFHGFTAWFSVQFQNIEDQGQVELNTGPFSPLTHWKHTLFMLDQPLQVHRGDYITGSALFHRNPIWRRHLLVALSWSITSTAWTTEHSVSMRYITASCIGQYVDKVWSDVN
ncbi:protein arginine N-methyltransferase 2 [Mixophyes fleayi]|uniref:protein arginine N-methyltransferase 2 n=1 Tax=Mixophyes fleayi TaxID=3061075 RepID=UPI003F4D74DE